ncbi:hypothetical protein ACFL6E_05680 [Candidatus Neomarinimicrobiota bacterium]
MSFEVHYDEDSGIIQTKFTGVLNQQVVEEFLRRMDEVLPEHPASTGHLVDATEAQLALAVADLYFLPIDLQAHSRRYNSKRAILVTQKERDKFDFLETAAGNQGYALRIFTDRGKAEDWLNTAE